MNPEVEYISKTVSLDHIRSHIMALEGERHPVTAPAALEAAAKYIEKSFNTLDYDVADHWFTDNNRFFRNIIATRRGSNLPHERVVLLAHYDTVQGTPGADDNASGVALLLETARVLERFRCERTIHFIAVNLEENEDAENSFSGTRGSRALAAYARENGWNIYGVVVLESVAYSGDSIEQSAPSDIPFPIPAVGNFIAVVGNECSKELIDGFSQAVEKYQPDLAHIELAVPGNGEILPDTRRSDHASFWDEGFKAVMLTDTTNFRNPNYHLPTDTLATLNLEFAVKVCCATAGAIFEIARFAEHDCKSACQER